MVRSKWKIALLVAGGEVPLFLLAVPGDRRLKQPALVLDEVGDAPRTRPQRILDLGLDLGDDTPLLVAPGLLVKLAAFATFDRELGCPRIERGRAVCFLSDVRQADDAATGASERPIGWRRNVSAISAWQRAHSASPTYSTSSRAFFHGLCGHGGVFEPVRWHSLSSAGLAATCQNVQPAVDPARSSKPASRSFRDRSPDSRWEGAVGFSGVHLVLPPVRSRPGLQGCELRSALAQMIGGIRRHVLELVDAPDGQRTSRDSTRLASPSPKCRRGSLVERKLPPPNRWATWRRPPAVTVTRAPIASRLERVPSSPSVKKCPAGPWLWK